MSDKTWKSIERKVASYLGGERVPITGRQRGSAPDIEHNDLAIEVKHRESFPNWIMDAMDQAVKSNKGGRTPIVILHEKGMGIERCLVVCELRDFRSLYERGRYKVTDHKRMGRQRKAGLADSSPQIG